MFSFIWDDLVWVMPAFLAVLCYITGDLAQMIFKVNRGIAVKVLSGFVLLLCIFHLTSLPFMYNDWPFTTLYHLFLCELISLIIAYSIVSLVKRRVPLQEDLEGLRKSILDTAKNRWWQFLLWAAAIVLIIWNLAMVIEHVAPNVDDNFYVSESLTILSRDRLMNVLPASGIEGSVFPATYVLVSWETLLAALSKMFFVTPAVFCHSLLPAFLIPLHYMAYYVAGREFFRKHTSIFLLFVLLLNFVCGPYTYNQGAFLTLRIWQGKSVLVNIMLPLLLYVFLRITKSKKVKTSNLFFLFAILLASQAATTVGTYLAPVLYAVYAITFLIIVRKFVQFLKLLIPAAAIAPFVFWKLWILISAGTLQDLSEGTGVYQRSFMELLTRYFGFSLIPLFFLIAIVVLAICLNKEPVKQLRFFFLIASALMILFFINPLVMPFVEHYVTGTGVYWRMFWLLQITLVIAVGFTCLCEIPKLQLARVTLVLLLSSVMLLSGSNIFNDEDVRVSFENHSKISETTRSIAYIIKNEVRLDHPKMTEEELREKEQQTILMLPRDLSDELRQYADISLICYAYYSNNYYAYQTKDEYKLLKQLYNTLYRVKSWEKETLADAVYELGIDYVAIDSETAEKNKANIPADFKSVYSGETYTLYKTNAALVHKEPEPEINSYIVY